MEKKAKKKLKLEELKIESFMETLSESELRKLKASGGSGSYGPACGATRSYNCYAICWDK